MTSRSLFVLPFLAVSITPALADTVQVTLRGGYVQSVTSGATTIEAEDLAPGRSSGEAQLLQQGGFPVTGADDRNVETYFVRVTASDPVWTVELDPWTDANGTGPDFFLFEAGGNDVVKVAAVLSGGSVGTELTLAGWTSTGYSAASGPNAGQQVHGLAFRRDQLFDAQGQPLPASAVIVGLRFESSTLDAGALLVHRPAAVDESDGDGTVQLVGEQRVGDLVELVYSGPFAWETDVLPNPFLDYRLDVELRGPGGEVLLLPGFFDADGAGGEHGRVWKTRFRPDVEGPWTAIARFREGADVAASLAPNAGASGLLDGVTVDFVVERIDRQAPGFLRWGRLRAGERYPRFSHGPAFLRTGTNSPENFLAYMGFDATTKGPSSSGVLHSYGPHVVDWPSGGPLFESRDRGVDSRGIIGAIEYLAGVGVNSITALVMNLGGDGQDAHPFLGPSDTAFDRTHYDTSRLAQWQAVFEHGARRGIAWNLYLGETETANQGWLDGGQLGVERKVLLREMVARFAHLPAVFWYVTEENDLPLDLVREFATHLAALDPYDNSIGFHNHPDQLGDILAVAGEPPFGHVALQFSPDLAGSQVESVRASAENLGRPWTVAAVEHTPYQDGVTDQNADEVRRRILWDALLSGGHVEWYLGDDALPLGGDHSVEDFRTRQATWRQTAAARRLLARLPFPSMAPRDDLLTGESATHGGGEVLALDGAAYVVYLPEGTSSGTLDLTGVSGYLLQRWFDPRSGKFVGPAHSVPAGSPLALGSPPSDPQNDWVVVLVQPRRTRLSK